MKIELKKTLYEKDFVRRFLICHAFKLTSKYHLQFGSWKKLYVFFFY